MKNKIFILFIFILFIFSGCTSNYYLTSDFNNINTIKNKFTKSNVNTKDDLGKTPLQKAIEAKNLTSVKYLVSLGANIYEKDSSKKTLMHYAVLSDSFEILKYLEKKGLSLNALTSEKESVLFFAAKMSSYETVKYLISKKLDVNAITKYTSTSLEKAAITNNYEVLKLLIKHGANINYVNKLGGTALLNALNNASYESAKYLLNNEKLIPNLGNVAGWSAVHYAAYPVKKYYNSRLKKYKSITQNQRLELLKLLNKKKFLFNKKNNVNKTALQYASKKGAYKNYNSVILYLKNNTQILKSPNLRKQIVKYEKKNNFKAIKKLTEKNPSSVKYINNPELRLALTGPKSLKVGDIRKLTKKKKMSEVLIIAQINRVKTPYKEFSIKEIEILQRFGLSDNIIAAMLNVTTKLTDKQEEIQRQNSLINKQKQVVTTNIKKHENQATSTSNFLLDKASDHLMKEGAKKLFESLF